MLALLASACGEDSHRAQPLAEVDGGTPICTVCGDCERAFAVTETTHHDDGIVYPDPPPPGGPHDPCWEPWGVHESPVRTERWVHNLEHGGIVFLYRPGDDGVGGAAELAAFASRHARVLVAPEPALPATFAALAWGHRLLSACFDQVAAEEFFARRFGMGPEDFDDGPPASCL